MKITIACKYLSQRGGAQTFLFNFVRHLLGAGHQVKVITMEADGAIEGVEVEKIPLPLLPKTFRDVTFARLAESALRNDQHDLSFGEQKTWGADVVRPGGGVHPEYMPQVIKSYPSAAMRLFRSFTKHISLKERLNLHIERKLYQDPDLRCVIANSCIVKRDLLKHYPDLRGRIAVVYNGTDCTRFGPQLRGRHRAEVRRELKLPEDALVGAFVSYDLRRKGLPTVLRALSILKKKYPSRSASAIVVGKRRAWAQRIAAKLDVRDRVRFVGSQQPDRYYGASDLLLLPSYFDPCANVTLEGLACGLPAITSVQNGAHELLTPGVDGFYVSDASNAPQMAGFVEYFFDEDRLERASMAARELALDHTLERMFGEIMDVLEPLAGQSTTAAQAAE
jgi:UDP-glucose:(heptosyl)LPS alpha-1,3-glucosyltransferase